MDLTYGKNTAVLQYAPTFSDGPATVDDITLEADAGWSALNITQNFGEPGGASDTVDSTNKHNLGTASLNTLFSGSTTVRVRNYEQAALSVEKVVKDAPASQNDAAFTMTLKLWSEDDAGAKSALKEGAKVGTKLSGSTDEPDTLTVGTELVNKTDGGNSWTEYTFPLKAGEVRIFGLDLSNGVGLLPQGTHYELTEAAPTDGSWLDPSYENNTGTADSAITPARVVVTNTWLSGLQVHKVDASNGGDVASMPILQGVEFTLYPATSDGSGPDTGQKGVMQPTGADGNAVFSKLAAGTYYLVETKALPGYQMLPNPLKVVVENGTVTFYNGGGEKQGEGVLEVTIENSKLPALPNTGGRGNLPLYALGMLLMGGAAYVVARGSRPRGEERRVR